MKNLKYIILFVLILKEINSKEENVTSNPCPDKFQYIHEYHNNYGILSIPRRSESHTKIEVKLTLAFHERRETENKFNIGFLKTFQETKLDVLSGLDLKLKIPFPKIVYWPIVTDISVNNNTICRGRNVNMWKVTYRQSFIYPKGPKPRKCIPSICSNVFQYKSESGGKDYGVITIPGPREGKTNVTAIIAIYEALDNNNTGSLNFLKSYDKTLADAQTKHGIQYKLKLPKFKYWPIITKITLNNVDICVGPEVTELALWTYRHKFDFPKLTNKSPRSRSSRYVIPATSVPNSRQSEKRLPLSKNWLGTFSLARYQSNCGKRDFIRNFDSPPVQMVIGGKLVEIGEYPWMVALFEFQRRKFVFFCGANLITDRYVITAAHCVKNKTQIQLKFGAYHLEETNRNSDIIRASKDIIVHSEYKDNQAHADIATISFESITFTRTIRPICIWRYETNHGLLVTKGHISGWGQADALEPGINLTPLQATMHRVSLDECRKSHIQLKNLASDHTFCAGGKVAGPCRGDSGSGFYVNISNTWYLRGIISTSLGTQLSCSVDKYSVFVDLVYYLDWIKDVIRSCRHYGKILKIDISVKISKY